MQQALVRTKIYTEDDYYRLPENIRAELIYGQFYDMSAPSRIHQRISVLYVIKTNLQTKDAQVHQIGS